MLKTHYCGELKKNLKGTKVTLAGWVDRRRDHGELIFIDLRDRTGIAQVVFNPQISKQCHEIAGQVRSEFVLQVTGEVALRPAGTENLKLPSGEIEVIVSEAEILNTSKTPPFYINEDSDVDENVRLKFRYLDLRRERMLKNLILRDNVIRFMRDFFHDKGFLDVETPIMVNGYARAAYKNK